MSLIVGNDGANALPGTAGADLIYGFDPDGTTATVSSISAQRVASGLSQPVFATAAPGDTNHLFIVERGGTIKVLDLTSGSVSVFLDLSSQVTTIGEGGLLGLAFDPDYAQNGQFYVDITNLSDDTEVRRYEKSTNDPLQADPSSALPIITIDQPNGLTNHKAGWIGFGPDGHLYVSLGDGGGGGDPSGNGQNPQTLLGKMLRLDVHGDDFPADATRNYAIPADNPFVGTAGVLPEIWALGLRNPYRDSFDRALGSLFIADVGQGAYEEIDMGQAGANYGWNVYEGPAGFQSGPLGPGTLTTPIHSYDNSVGHAVIGGYVYRGESDGLQGQYFFADYVANRVFTLQQQGSSWVATERTGQIVADVGSINVPGSFGEDALGNLYLLDLDGEVFRLTPNTTSSDAGDTIDGLAGNDIIHGGTGDDGLNGGDGADSLYGGTGNDQLVGQSGDDAMTGGAGNDGYYVDSTGDRVIEGTGSGSDRVLATVDYALPAGQEIELLTPDAAGVAPVLGTNPINLSGNEFANTIWGNAAANVLAGGGGNDSLYGFDGDDHLIGQTGDDAMTGGAGNDGYYVDSTGDRVIEGTSGGTDRVLATVDYVLGAGQEIELLTPDAAGVAPVLGTNPINLSGNEFANTIWGNAAANVLAGGGGNDSLYGFDGDDRLNGQSGDDTMTGGAGNDGYYVDGIGDRVVEGTGSGIDRVLATVDYALEAGQEIELLTPDAAGVAPVLGTNPINLSGNEFANTIWGNAAANVLLGGGDNDSLYGFDSDDQLNGQSGDDTMTGGAGNDTFIFNTATTGGTNVDTIADFNAAQDTIVLSQAIFAGLTPGALDPSQFAIDSATGSGPQIVYRSASGSLHYDSNGATAGGETQFATLTGAPVITASDFFIL